MDYQFQIKGISCGSCIQKIAKFFNDQFGIHGLSFTNNNSTIKFSSSAKVDIGQLNELLSTIGEYTLSDVTNLLSVPDNTQEVPSYKPIYLIFAYIAIISILTTLQHGITLQNFMVNFMAGFFLVFSFFKLLDLSGFAMGYSSYDIVAKKWYHYGYIYPFIELGFGLSYLLFGTNIYLNGVVFIVMLVSSIGVIRAKLSKQRFDCACVGTFLKVPLGNIAIIEDVAMVIMSFIMLIMAIQL